MTKRVDLRAGRAAQYIRMSTEHQQYSTAHQRMAIARYAQDHGLTVTHTYADEGRSGLRIQRRPALRQLIQDVQAGADFSCILVYDVSRWGRFQDIDESAHYEFLCRSAGVSVRYCNEQFGEATTLANDVLKTIKRAMAGEFSRELSGKVHRGHLYLAGFGYRQGAPPLYGFRRVVLDASGEPQGVLSPGEYKSIQSHRVILVLGPEEERQVVRDVYRLFVVGGLSPQAVADYLNQEGVAARAGTSWTRASIVRMLTNELYVGNYVYNKVGGLLKSRRVENQTSAWVRCVGAVEPMVDTAMFEAAQDLIKQRSGVAGRSQAVKGSKGSSRFKGVEVALQRTLKESANNGIEPPETIRLSNGFRCYREKNNCLGWVAMVTLEGVRQARYFADSKYGSAEAARAAAERAGAEDQHIQKEWAAIKGRLRVRSTSRSGIPGVTRYEATARRRAHWMAYWTDSLSSKRVYRRFYVGDHGEEGSRERAVEARRLATECDRQRLVEIADYLRTRGWVITGT